MTFHRRAASLAPFLSSLNNCTTSYSSRISISPRLSFSTAASSATEQAAGSGFSAGRKTKRSLGRQLFQIGLISLTGGFFLSAVNDLAIFHRCSSKAIEKASQNQQIVELLGSPIVRGPWYDASLAVGRRRHSVSSTFPVSGPQGTGIFHLKAIRRGDETTFSFLSHNDWDILILDALVHVPSNDEKHQTVRISVTDNCPLPNASSDCVQCQLPRAASATPGK
ncbi:uncharacterized protein LOC141819898 [Curcuma longa]|uniref:uncharacterized protein LOC141819898 n=1 Tax=Curcuma longa TaxID=136217 RepID=UPI003D9F8653